MNIDAAALEVWIQHSRCRVFGSENAENDSQRGVLASLVHAFNREEVTLLCEPSLARGGRRPPDIVLIDPAIGVHVFEVKGMDISKVGLVEPGGGMQFQYKSGLVTKNPIVQVRQAMFDIRDSVVRHYGRPELDIRFEYWVVWPRIRQTKWRDKFGEDAFRPPEMIFQETLESSRLKDVLAGGYMIKESVDRESYARQLQCVSIAFGDSSVLYPEPGGRPARKVGKETLGARFDEAAESYKGLSEEQQNLSEMSWEEGPRQVRGVAGSGKTVVLANNMARELLRGENLELLEKPRKRVLAVCFNRSLVPFLREKITQAYKQRTGETLEAIDVIHNNGLMRRLNQKGLFRYHPIDKEEEDDGARAKHYLEELLHTKKRNPALFEANAFDAIYVDEGQDFHEDEFKVLKELCSLKNASEGKLCIFYDDAQNLYGRDRPNWRALGINVVGRSRVMRECFRNTRQIIEPAFNVLYGSFAARQKGVPTRAYGEVGKLEEEGLIQNEDGKWRVHFARREGMKTEVITTSKKDERRLVIDKIRWLVDEEKVRPEDIVVLTKAVKQSERLADMIRNTDIAGVDGVHSVTKDKDKSLRQSGKISVSTIHSAKGYDAYCVLLVWGDTGDVDVAARACFYVAATRAIEYLAVFGTKQSALLSEMKQAAKWSTARDGQGSVE